MQGFLKGTVTWLLTWLEEKEPLTFDREVTRVDH
jgi:hypothetical protein